MGLGYRYIIKLMVIGCACEEERIGKNVIEEPTTNQTN